MLGFCLVDDMDPRSCMQAAILSDVVVIGTGKGPSGVSSKMYLLNCANSELSTVRTPEVLHPRYNYAICSILERDAIFLHGGTAKMGCLNNSSCFYYISLNNDTLQASRMRLQNHTISPRQMHCCCSIGDDFVLLAGGKDKSYTPLHDIYVIDVSTGHCQKLDTTIPEGLTDFSLVYYGECVLFVGGLIEGKVVSDSIFEYNLSTCTWSQKQMPRPLCKHMSLLWNGYLVNVFGLTQDGTPMRGILLQHIDSGRWFTVAQDAATLTGPELKLKTVPHRCSFASAIVGDTLLICGGLSKEKVHLSDLWAVPLPSELQLVSVS